MTHKYYLVHATGFADLGMIAEELLLTDECEEESKKYSRRIRDVLIEADECDVMPVSKCIITAAETHEKQEAVHNR